LRARLLRAVAGATEGLVLVLVCVSPWLFASVEPLFEFLLYVGVGILLLLWAARMLLEWQFSWKKDPLLLCLGGLFLLGVFELQPLPRSVLSVLSPSTARIYEEMLPAAPEQLPLDQERLPTKRAAGASLSLYPAATERALIRLLAVFGLYAVVRNNCTGAGALRRLSIALVLNGVALSLFAIIQFVSSPHDTVYWSYKTLGAVFGPFICRTHFAAYVNICIGAGIGLLLALPAAAKDNDPPAKKRLQPPGTIDWKAALAPVFSLLDDPRKLWLGGALALMIAAVALSLARGGFLSLLGASSVFLLLPQIRSLTGKWVGPAVVGAMVALAMVIWIGFERVESRIETIWTGEALSESRLPLWADAWPLVTEFPLWGTGYGTFRYAEPLHRERVSSRFYHEHAHNEFLEAMTEGGVVRLALMCLGIGLMFWFGFRAVRRHAGTATGTLALGALFGFTTLVIHSVGDFGIHLPAITLLATVVCAHLAALGQDAVGAAVQATTAESAETPDPVESAVQTAETAETGPHSGPYGDRPDPEPAPDAYVFRFWGAAPLAAAMTALVLALTLWGDGLRRARVQSLWIAARNLDDKTAQERQQRLALLEAAANMAPNNAGVQVELAEAQLAIFQQQDGQWSRSRTATEVSQFVLSFSPSAASAFVPPVWAVPSGLTGSLAWETAVAAEKKEAFRRHMVPALQRYLLARDLCPLLSKPQIRLAASVPYLAKADPALAYVDRAKRVVTNDPDLLFLFGVQEILLGQKERAIDSWHRSLALSDRNVEAVLQLGRGALTSREFAERVLPEKPEILLAAALRLYPQTSATEERRPLLEKALVLMKAQGPSLRAENFYVQAQVHQYLGQIADALKAYQKAVSLAPRQSVWRLAYARLLRADGKDTEATRELYTILQYEPRHPEARALLVEIDRSNEKLLPRDDSSRKAEPGPRVPQ
jgi:O-antigen ligase/tetratricopeptide (TPR) repeat protein